MKIAMHSEVFSGNTISEDILIAKEAGFDGVELNISKLMLEWEGKKDIGWLDTVLCGVHVPMLDAVLGIERLENQWESGLIDLLNRACALAVKLNCGTIQVVALDGLNNCQRHERIRKMTYSLSILADIAWSHRIRLAIEPVCFSAFQSLSEVLEVIASVGSHRMGIILDTWHLWINNTSAKEISALDPHLIMGAHLGDSKPRQGAVWSDDARGALPGEGVVPMRLFVEAIKTTGYDGWWTVEVHGRDHFAALSDRQLAYAMYQSAVNLLN